MSPVQGIQLRFLTEGQASSAFANASTTLSRRLLNSHSVYARPSRNIKKPKVSFIVAEPNLAGSAVLVARYNGKHRFTIKTKYHKMLEDLGALPNNASSKPVTLKMPNTSKKT